MSDYVPHQDLDAEAAVLSTCMLVPEAYDEVTTILSAEHFYADSNRRVWEAIEHLSRESKKVDVVSVASHLRQTGRLEQIGGSPYIAQLANSTPAVSHVLDHAKLVFDAWRKRSLVALLQGKLGELRATKDGIHNEALDTFALGVCSDIETIAAGKGVEETLMLVSDIVKNVVDNVIRKQKDGTPIAGILTGIKALDEKINGLDRGSKYTVAARPGIGKSGFLCSVALNIARNGFGVVLCSVEMPKEQLTERMIATMAGISTRSIKNGQLDKMEWARFTKATNELSRLPIAIEDAGVQSEQSIRSSTRRGLKKLRDKFPGINLGLIGIDYLQIIQSTSKKKSDQSRDREVATISNATRSLAKELNCPLIELSQLNRECEKRPDKRPLLSDLRDSGAIEQDSFGIFMLYRDDYYRKDEDTKDGLAEILIRKLRDGGDSGVVRCQFDGPSTSFFDLDDSQQSFGHY